MKRIISFVLMFSILFFFFPQVAFANAPGPNLDNTFGTRPFQDIIALFLLMYYIFLIAFTCFVELWIAKPFELRELYGKWIVITNIITQIAMHILEWLAFLLCPVPVSPLIWYPVMVVLLEILVVISEFLVYRRKFAGVTTKECLLYTLCANAASAIGGLLLLMIII